MQSVALWGDFPKEWFQCKSFGKHTLTIKRAGLMATDIMLSQDPLFL